MPSKVEGAEELKRLFRQLPEQLQKNALSTITRKGAETLQLFAEVHLSVAMRTRNARKGDVVVKKQKAPKGQVQSMHAVGPNVNRPQLRWLHTGTRGHPISARVKYGTRRGRVGVAYGERDTQVLASRALGKFFGLEVFHPGQVPTFWLLGAQHQSKDQVFAAMAAELRKALPRQARRLASTKYTKRLLGRIGRQIV